LLPTGGGVIDEQHDDRTDDGDEHAVDIQPRDGCGTEKAEKKSPNNGARDTEYHIENQAFTSLIYNPARYESGNKTEDDPTYNRHNGPFRIAQRQA
jgi:hypothetical protein